MNRVHHIAPASFRLTSSALGFNLLLVLAVSLTSCSSNGRSTTVTEAVTRSTAPGDSSAPPLPRGNLSETVATVNGRPILRRQVVDLLLRAHGTGILEQLIVLEAAKDRAAELGISVAPTDIKWEEEESLRTLVDPLASVSGRSLDRATAAQVLQSLLSERNISYDEYLVGIKRNAYLRKVAMKSTTCSEAQLREEFRRLYDRRVVSRHIQVATIAESTRCREQLDRGEPFGDLARRYSANLSSAANGGLLEPFARNDSSVPEPFRAAAFKLKPGQVSPAVPVGRWLHLIKVEDYLPATSTDFDAHREEIEKRLRKRLALPAMKKLHQSLFDKARVRISDPLLRDAFLEKHPDRAAGMR